MSSKSKRPRMRRGAEVRRDRIQAWIEVKPDEDLVTAVKRSQGCPDCDCDIELGPDVLHVIHRATCPRVRSWQKESE